MKTLLLFTRQDYMAGRCDHRQYYNQFVTPHIRERVLETFGIDLLKSAFERDEHLNSIRLIRWDNLGLMLANDTGYLASLKKCGDFDSFAGRVCVLKEAAKQIIN